MQDDEFEWDDAKAAANVVKHGVWFETARDVFKDGEERFLAVGMVRGELLAIVCTERGERIRLISARRATKHEQDDYFRRST